MFDGWDGQDFYFQWPWALALLLLLPVLTLLYGAYQRRRWQAALRFSYTSVLQHLQQYPSKWKGLVAPLTALGVAAFLILAIARPTVVTRVPTRSVDMMLVMDISLSMMATDMAPNRMVAAREAGIRFVESLPKEVRIGLAFFAGNTYVVTSPIRDHRKVAAYLKSLSLKDLQPRTEIGSAMQTVLKTFATPLLDGKDSPSKKEKPPQRVMVLLSDGDSREGYPWQQAARNAQEQNVVVYTVGIGSPQPTTILYQNQVLPVTFSEATLHQIAQLAGGEYFRVFSEKDFKTVYQKVRDRAIDYVEEPEDLGYGFSLAALVWLALGLGLSVLWVKKLPL